MRLQKLPYRPIYGVGFGQKSMPFDDLECKLYFSIWWELLWRRYRLLIVSAKAHHVPNAAKRWRPIWHQYRECRRPADVYASWTVSNISLYITCHSTHFLIGDLFSGSADRMVLVGGAEIAGLYNGGRGCKSEVGLYETCSVNRVIRFSVLLTIA